MNTKEWHTYSKVIVTSRPGPFINSIQHTRIFILKKSHTNRNAYAHPVAVASTEIQAMKIFAN